MGLDDEGLPTGVQVAAIHGHDHVSIAVAQALEEATGGWIWPAALADATPPHKR
jgi:fatty acid amide hydrolase 2